MSQTLPEATEPPQSAIARGHSPEGSYSRYRACLRWDFGFTCVFCLRHESDIVPSGAEGWGVTSAEHLLPQSASAADANKYANVVYCCKRCNRDRSTKQLVDSMNRRLLEPTKDVWSCHFFLDGEVVRPSEGDADAEYTEDAYKMNATKKRDARRLRATKIRAAVDRIQRDRERETKLIQLARDESDATRKMELFRMAQEIRRDRKEIVEEFISTYRAVPIDAPWTCRCASPPEYKLPAWFARQCISAPTI